MNKKNTKKRFNMAQNLLAQFYLDYSHVPFPVLMRNGYGKKIIKFR